MTAPTLRPGAAPPPVVRCEPLGTVTLDALAGEGGMGRVWTGRSDAGPVAVKVLAPHLVDTPEAHRRFEREVTIAETLDSRRVPRLLGRGVTADGVPCFAMDLARGLTLEAVLAGAPRLSPARTAAIVGQVLEAIADAHRAGITHRDVKPGNVMVHEAGDALDVKLLDFGVARAPWSSSIPLDSHTLGTLRYMSPELLFDARSAGPECDLWAAAVIAYECLTGRAPFPSESLGRFALALDAAAFTPATTLSPTLPDAVDAFFAKAFARDPGARYRSAPELADALAAACAEPARATPARATPARRSRPLTPGATRAVMATASRRMAARLKLAPPRSKEATRVWSRRQAARGRRRTRD